MEQLDLKNTYQFQEGGDEILHVFGDNALTPAINGETRPEKRLQAQILTELLSVDRERAITTMKAWTRFIDLASRTRTTDLKAISALRNSYRFWFGMLTFALALTIPPSELDLCMSLARPGYEAISLVNDLYSWRKEREEAALAGQDHVFNAIWVIMCEKNCAEEEAMAMCTRKIIQRVAEFDGAVKKARTTGLSKDPVEYLEAVRLSYIGNLVWSIYCPRYN
ncbi:hypothetical protein N0V83_006473 [Neocucurbitaria cava]|uniref:Terpenoid synthase n=1 Tax=Neocucurbitaria cava TaxID=798079 RepID=A0A9W9CLA1_9PLEO|nr:hypothetical protein N0V83_006473 [Neocucurbitaria cava]